MFLVGTAWVMLQPPDPSDKLIQTAVGFRSAWICAESGKVIHLLLMKGVQCGSVHSYISYAAK